MFTQLRKYIGSLLDQCFWNDFKIQCICHVKFCGVLIKYCINIKSSATTSLEWSGGYLLWTPKFFEVVRITSSSGYAKNIPYK